MAVLTMISTAAVVSQRRHRGSPRSSEGSDGQGRHGCALRDVHAVPPGLERIATGSGLERIATGAGPLSLSTTRIRARSFPANRIGGKMLAELGAAR
jgi:hypothetical protein